MAHTSAKLLQFIINDNGKSRNQIKESTVNKN